VNQSHRMNSEHLAHDELGRVIAESEQRRRLYETVLSNTPDLVYVFDLNHRFTYANEILLKMWGRTWDEAIGKNCLELGYESWHAEMHGREIEQVKASRKSIRGEVPFKGAFGRRTYDYIFVPVFGPDGEVEAIAGTTRDITERKQIEESLRESKAHLSSLFEQSSVGICESDLEGRLLNVNERFCQLMGRRPDELVGRKMREITHPDDLPGNTDMFLKLLATGESFEMETRYLCADGSFIWGNTSVSLIRIDDERNHDTVLAVVQDISDRKKAEDALRLGDRRKDEFLAMLAHELRNPLAPISAAAHLLRLQAKDDVPLQKVSDIISRQVRHMTDLVDDLLDVSRVTRGLVQLNKESLDLKSVVSNAVEQVRSLYETRRHSLNIRIEAEHALVNGDRTRLIQVIVNLMNNAAKYTAPGGEIALSVEVRSGKVKISVADNGIGIDAALLPHVFELFTQAERTPDRSQGGLGIGLALVKSIVTLHDGDVVAHSAGPGTGSVFTLTLPLIQNKAPSPGSELGEGATPAAKSVRVIIVDDNHDAAHMLASVLEAAGHQVTVVADAASTFARAAEAPPQAFILDIGLPDMDGYELARRLRADAKTATALYIALTGYGQAHDRAMSRSAGFDHHFVKPVEMQDLIRILCQVD
jgi:PAS domain S-box-containing protein